MEISQQKQFAEYAAVAEHLPVKLGSNDHLLWIIGDTVYMNLPAYIFAGYQNDLQKTLELSKNEFVFADEIRKCLNLKTLEFAVLFAEQNPNSSIQQMQQGEYKF